MDTHCVTAGCLTADAPLGPTQAVRAAAAGCKKKKKAYVVLLLDQHTVFLLEFAQMET